MRSGPGRSAKEAGRAGMIGGPGRNERRARPEWQRRHWHLCEAQVPCPSNRRGPSRALPSDRKGSLTRLAAQKPCLGPAAAGLFTEAIRVGPRLRRASQPEKDPRGGGREAVRARWLCVGPARTSPSVRLRRDRRHSDLTVANGDGRLGAARDVELADPDANDFLSYFSLSLSSTIGTSCRCSSTCSLSHSISISYLYLCFSLFLLSYFSLALSSTIGTSC